MHLPVRTLKLLRALSFAALVALAVTAVTMEQQTGGWNALVYGLAFIALVVHCSASYVALEREATKNKSCAHR